MKNTPFSLVAVLVFCVIVFGSHSFEGHKFAALLRISDSFEEQEYEKTKLLLFHKLNKDLNDLEKAIQVLREKSGLPPMPEKTLPPKGTAACNPVQVLGKTYYVSPNGNDANPGTQSMPWKTIIKAATAAQAGDMVLIVQGLYNTAYQNKNDVSVMNSGSPGAEIIFKAMPGHERKVILDNKTFRIEGKSHIQVCGLKIQNVTNGIGFFVRGPVDINGNETGAASENITISGNETDNTFSSAIAVWGVNWGKNPGDYDNVRNVIIENNLIQRAVNGGWNEDVTVANGVTNVIIRNNIFQNPAYPAIDQGGEGIDLKDGVRQAEIYNNIFGTKSIAGTRRKAIYIDGGRDSHIPTSGSNTYVPFVNDVKIYNNIIYNDPNDAIAIVTEGIGTVNNISIFNNLIAGSEQTGILVYKHPLGTGAIDDINIVNNTIWEADRKQGGWDGITINHSGATNIEIRNNIVWQTKGAHDIDLENGSQALISHNLCRANDNLCEIETDPQFFDVTLRNFRLKNTSPAIDAGNALYAPLFDLDLKTRPQGSAFDLGAYEQ